MLFRLSLRKDLGLTGSFYLGVFILDVFALRRFVCDPFAILLMARQDISQRLIRFRDDGKLLDLVSRDRDEPFVERGSQGGYDGGYCHADEGASDADVGGQQHRGHRSQGRGYHLSG